MLGLLTLLRSPLRTSCQEPKNLNLPKLIKTHADVCSRFQCGSGHTADVTPSVAGLNGALDDVGSEPTSPTSPLPPRPEGFAAELPAPELQTAEAMKQNSVLVTATGEYTALCLLSKVGEGIVVSYRIERADSAAIERNGMDSQRNSLHRNGNARTA
jgi:hypothetical protein